MLFLPQEKESFPCSSLGSLPQQTVLHEILQSESFSQTAVLHKLIQCGILPARNLFQYRLPTGSQPLLWHPPALVWGSSTGCRWISAALWPSTGIRGTGTSPWSFPRAAGESLLQHLEQLLAFLPWPPCLHNGLSHIYSLLSSLLQLFLCHFNFPLLKYIIVET